ncbi:MAG: rod shape-determining protein MreC [Clostridia bacterium]|nr:rod shape-determining protein MreC [Clostridia bacterium]
MKFFNEYKRQLITLAVIVLAVISFFTAGRKINAGFFDDVLGFVITPFQGAVSSVTGWVNDSVNDVIHRNELADENRELKKRIEELETENARLSLYEDENKKLSELLETAQKYKDYDTTGASVIAKDTGVWYDSFLIDKGETDGIENNMAVINAGGLVGRVVKTSAVYSKVYSILDSRSSVSAQSLRTGDLGVVVGDHELMEQGLCKMEYIDSDAEIMEGDEIITSGLSEYYPAGISIGYVKEIHQDENGLTKYAVIEPKADFKHIDTVLVIMEALERPTEVD